MEFSYLQGKKDITPMRVFLREKWRTESLGEALSDLAYGTDPPSLLTSSEWVNFPFLWVKQRVPYLTPNVIVPNAKLKLTGGSLIDGAKINDPDWTYYGRGYGNYERRYNFDAGPRMYYGKAFNEPINPRKLEHLSDICSLCAENGVELVVVNVAQPEFAMISLGEGEYTRTTDAIKNVVEGAGMRYFDFNCASSELFDPQDEYFEDWQHFNIVGGTAFSNAMVSLMKRVDAGEDVSSLFESYADHVAGIQEISSIDVSRALTNEGVDLHIACYAGSKVKPEFQILAKGEGEQEYRVVRDWSADPDFRYHLEKHCVTNIRVNAREQGSSEPFERYRAFDVLS
ncbi:MAG: hypothetical protein IJH04_10280 [Eggerthellaceae bacterium]|nr:hypothetical protein [Eggerthellaceae bacterium]